MNLPDKIQELCQALLDGLDAALSDKLAGIYLYGALTFPEGGSTGDIDFHVILGEPLDAGQKLAVKDLHAALARDYPPLGEELDGYYILLEDARRTLPPQHQLLPEIIDNAWALHRAHILAGRCFVLHGPDPQQIFPPATWPELESALYDELDYVKDHLTDYPAYCVLNLCRLIYSFETKDVVVSKRGAAAWALDAIPQWRPLIEAARKSYDGRDTMQDREFLKSEVRHLYDFACQRIQESQT
jgi:hypothetical protein